MRNGEETGAREEEEGGRYERWSRLRYLETERQDQKA